MKTNSTWRLHGVRALNRNVFLRWYVRVGAQLSANQLFQPFWRPPSARCCCLEEVGVCWTMNGGRTPPEGCESPVQGPCQPSHRWHHYRKSWQRSDPQPASQQPLDRYKWRTSACLAPRAAKMAAPKGNGQKRESRHRRLLSLPRFSTIRHDQSGDESSTGHEGPARTGTLRRIFPYLRSMSEPGTGSGPARTAVRKVGSDAAQQASSISSFISSFSQRISRVLRDEPQTEGAESGRTFSFHQGRHETRILNCDTVPVKRSRMPRLIRRQNRK